MMFYISYSSCFINIQYGINNILKDDICIAGVIISTSNPPPPPPPPRLLILQIN